MSKQFKLTLIAVVAVFLVVMGIVTIVAANKPTAAQVQPLEIIYTPQSLLAQANKLRAEKGVAPLKLDERLNRSAQWKADDMKQFNYFDHVRDGYNGAYKAYAMTSPKGDMVDSECVQASENIHKNYEYGTPFNVSGHGWENSPAHYAAIVDPKYDTTGFGMVNDNGKVLYVEHFCDLR